MVPKTFVLVNRKWRVRRLTSKQIQAHLDSQATMIDYPKGKELLGLCDQKTNQIFLNTDLHATEEELEGTYWHEFMHAFFFAEGQNEHDETVVDRLGGFLHQYEQTKK